MSFGWPAAFWGLLGLSIPLAIHLLQKGHWRRVQVGSLRWFHTNQQPKWRTIKISEVPLLIVRVLLVSLVVFILAKPFVKDDWAKSGQSLTLIYPGLTPGSYTNSVRGDVRWLADGFPPVNASSPETPDDFWGLLQQIDSLVDADRNIHVIAPIDIRHFGETRPFLRRTVTWEIPVPNTESTNFTNSLPEQLYIVYSPETTELAKNVALAVTAWQAVGIEMGINLVEDEAVGLADSWTIWLSTLPVDSISPVVVTGQILGSSLPYDLKTQVAGVNGIRVVTWSMLASMHTKPLPKEFPDQLLAIFLEHAKPIDHSIQAPLNQVIPPVEPTKAFVNRASSQIPDWLLTLLVALFCIERLLGLLPSRSKQ